MLIIIKANIKVDIFAGNSHSVSLVYPLLPKDLGTLKSHEIDQNIPKVFVACKSLTLRNDVRVYETYVCKEALQMLLPNRCLPVPQFCLYMHETVKTE